jgi:hypothetical protein
MHALIWEGRGPRQAAVDERLLCAVRGFLGALELLACAKQEEESGPWAIGKGGALPAPPRPRSRRGPKSK